MLKILTLGFVMTLASIASSDAHQPLSYGPSISRDAVKLTMSAAESEATKNNWRVVIAIVDAAGRQQLLTRMDDAPYGSIPIAIGKAETAFNFRQATKQLQDRVNSGTAMHLLTSGSTLIEGGIPLVIAGKVVGAIGVSGGATFQDEQVAKAGAGALL